MSCWQGTPRISQDNISPLPAEEWGSVRKTTGFEKVDFRQTHSPYAIIYIYVRSKWYLVLFSFLRHIMQAVFIYVLEDFQKEWTGRLDAEWKSLKVKKNLLSWHSYIKRSPSFHTVASHAYCTAFIRIGGRNSSHSFGEFESSHFLYRIPFPLVSLQTFFLFKAVSFFRLTKLEWSF